MQEALAAYHDLPRSSLNIAYYDTPLTSLSKAYHDSPHASPSKAYPDNGLATKSTSYIHGRKIGRKIGRKFTDYQEKELVDRIKDGNHWGHKAFVMVANKLLKEFGKDYQVRYSWSQLFVRRHGELHNRLRGDPIDFTESSVMLNDQGKDHRPPLPPLPKTTDAERFIAERFVDHAPEAMEDIDHFLACVQSLTEKTPEFREECKKWMDHYRHLLAENARLIEERDAKKRIQQANVSLTHLSAAAVSDDTDDCIFTREQELELVNRLLDSNCAFLADFAVLAEELLREIGNHNEGVLISDMISLVRRYPQLRPLVDKQSRRDNDPEAPKTDKKLIYTYHQHRNMGQAGRTALDDNASQQEERARAEPELSTNSNPSKSLEENGGESGSRALSVDDMLNATSENAEERDGSPELLDPPNVIQNVTALRHGELSETTSFHLNLPETRALGSMADSQHGQPHNPAPRPLSAWEANRRIERLQSVYLNRRDAAMDDPRLQARKFTDEQELELSIRVLERVGRTRGRAFPVLKAEGECMLAEQGKEAKINSFWTTKFLARHSELQEQIEELRTRPESRDSTPDAIADEELLTTPVTPRALEKWTWRYGGSDNADGVAGACMQKLIKGWSESRNRNAILEAEINHLRAQLGGYHATDPAGGYEYGTEPSLRLSNSNKKLPSKQSTQKATCAPKRRREGGKENTINVEDFDSNGVRTNTPKRRQKA